MQQAPVFESRLSRTIPRSNLRDGATQQEIERSIEKRGREETITMEQVEKRGINVAQEVEAESDRNQEREWEE